MMASQQPGWWKVGAERAIVRDAPSRDGKELDAMAPDIVLLVSAVEKQDAKEDWNGVDTRGATWLRLDDGELRYLRQPSERAYVLASDADGEWLARLPTETLAESTQFEGGVEALLDAELAPAPRTAAASKKAAEFLAQLNERRERLARTEAAHRKFMDEMYEEELRIQSSEDPTATILELFAKDAQAEEDKRRAEQAQAEAQATAVYQQSAGPPRPPGLEREPACDDPEVSM